jgi:hypothetical protein
MIEEYGLIIVTICFIACLISVSIYFSAHLTKTANKVQENTEMIAQNETNSNEKVEQNEANSNEKVVDDHYDYVIPDEIAQKYDTTEQTVGHDLIQPTISLVEQLLPSAVVVAIFIGVVLSLFRKIDRLKTDSGCKIKRDTVDTSSKQVTVEPTGLDYFQALLSDAGIQLSKYIDTIEDDYVKGLLKTIKHTWVEILENTDETEYNKGNIARLTKFFIPQFLNLVSKYQDIEAFKTKEAKQSREQLKQAFEQSVTIFENIYQESISKELVNATVDADVFIQMAEMNGLVETQNTLKLSQ